MSLPALESLRAEYTEVWTTRENCPLVRFADRVNPIADTGLDYLGLPEIPPPPALVQRLKRFDQIISWYGTSRQEVRTATANLCLNAVFLPTLPPDEGLHAVDFYMKQARMLGGRPHLPLPFLPCHYRPRPYAVIHPFSGSERKNWGLDAFREVARRLKVGVTWTVGPDEAFEGAVKMTDRYELACWLAGARCFIGNDSGVTHLAAAVGTPVVAIFGPSAPEVWQPRGPKVTVLRADSRQLADVTIEQVIHAAHRYL